MGQVRVLRVDDDTQFAEMRTVFEGNHPDLRLTRVRVDGDRVLRSERGGMRVFWIYRGRGEVFLSQGYRTQEGDGGRLPNEYRPDPPDPAFADTLQRLKSRLANALARGDRSRSSDCQPLAGRGVCGRLRGRVVEARPSGAALVQRRKRRNGDLAPCTSSIVSPATRRNKSTPTRR